MRKIRSFIAKILIAAFLVTNLLTYFPTPSYAAAAKDKGSTAAVSAHHEKTEILVKYKDSGKEDKVKGNLKKRIKLSKISTKKSYAKTKIDLLEIGEKDDIAKVVDELKKDPDVLYAQPNYKLDVMAAPADPMFDSQWGLQNVGQEIEGQLGRTSVDINAVNAWNLTQGSSSVVIGILDTGVDLNHKDLKDNIFVNSAEIPNNGIDDDNNGYVDDVNGWDFVNNDKSIYDDASKDSHGTHVAGILAAASDNTGITGVAPKVKVLPLKFINGNWGYTCDAITAIEYAMKMGVKLINCSFGGTDDNFALKDAMANSGILFICAAGNRGADVSVLPVYPACFDIPNVISVTSIDSKGVLSPYASYGNKVQVAAPGVDILSTMPGNTYDYFTGTSAAVPFVTGIAALLQSYLPNLTIAQIAKRIKDNVVPCTNLGGKVSTGGRVDAYAALTNTRPAADTYTGEGNGNSTVPAGQQGGNIDTWYTMDQLAKIKEQLHYGESGVSPASGNFSFTVNDMSVPAPGFQVNISRSYNSRSDKSTPLGRGWTFGFEGKAEGTNVVDVTLPTGSVERFRLNNNVYEPEESRSAFVKNGDGTYTLTTKDQYKYTFNTDRFLSKMEDRNGNAVDITVDSAGKISKITDTVGREYKVTYNSNGLIDNITDVESRTVRYQYDSNNRLTTVTDPMGGIMRYSYDTWGFLNEIKDHNQKTVEKIVYNHSEGENQDKVSEATDSLGDTVKYTYDMPNKKTTATDMNNRVSTYWFDEAFYTTQLQEPDGKSSYTEYFLYDGKNKYGDVKATTDRNGNKTQYEVDARGNETRITNPDGSSRINEYDEKNNLIKEVDESGKATYYIYDDSRLKLMKKVQPLNGTDVYEGTDSPGFAVTSYQYYTDNESGCNAKALLKSETSPEGSVTDYTYDAYGNVKTVSDPETGKLTSYEYNKLGWKLAETTPKGNRTEYTYDKNGTAIKSTIISAKNETQRVVYDLLGRKLQEISPNQYDSSKDDTAADSYSDAAVGTSYEYYDSGKVKTITDALGNKTAYTYDVYGNTLTETKPNGAIYRYTYDVLDRPEKVYFKNDSTAAEVLLTEYSYAYLEDGKTQKTETVYLNSTDKAVTVAVYDYADRLVEQQNPDGTRTKTLYNANGTVDRQISANGSSTCYKYDGLNRLAEQWSPFEIANGNTFYTYTKYTYDKAGNKISEKTGKDKVTLWTIPESYIVKDYTYYKNGKLKAVSDAQGRRTEYIYDADGNMIRQSVYTDSTHKLVTEFEYNHLQKISSKKQQAEAGDIYGNTFDSSEALELVTTYTYDKNGNVKTSTTPEEVTTTYEYDALDRQLSQSRPGTDETGASVEIAESTTWSWEGKPLTSKDAKGNITSYEYNQRGFLTRTTDAQNGVWLYEYDLAGRKTAEVTPQNYISSEDVYHMNRSEYVYDLMSRVTAKKDVYREPVSGLWTTLYTRTCKYDNSGNVVKELDAIGYDYGTGSSQEEKIASGYGIEYRYNLANLLTSTLDAVSKERALYFTSKYEYDGLGRKTSETNSKGVETCYTYDDAGNILTVSVKKGPAAEGQKLRSSAYDLAGRQLTQTDANGNTTSFEYNALGQVRRLVYPGDSTMPSNTVLFQYDAVGNLKLRQDSLGKVNLYTYDKQGRQLAATEKKSDNTQAITTFAGYDVNGNKCRETDGNGVTRTNTFDALNRLTASEITVNGVKQTTTYGYDANGNQTTSTDWLGNTTTNLYDPLNRLIEKKNPYTTIQKLEYNKNSKQIKSVDALGNMTRFIYDRSSRLIATIDPEGHTTSQAYDDVGNIIARTDGRNITTTYKYDEFNRLLSVINPKAQVTSYTYDLNGNKLTQTDGNGNTTAYEYNGANKVIKRIDQGGRLGLPGAYTYLSSKTEKYTYNADGSIKSSTDRNGRQTTYSYDIHGRLLSKAIGGSSIAYAYDRSGNQTAMTDSTGTTSRTYDELGRVLTKTVPSLGTTVFTYDGDEGGGLRSETTRDPKGNLTEKVYDKAGRLYKVIADGKATTYEYYADGSRRSVTYGDGAKEEYTYYGDGLNKTLVNKKADGSSLDSYSYTYDGAHNQTSKTDAKGVTSYEYDSLNRLEKVTEPNGRTTSYTFDKAGNRLTETVLAAVVTTSPAVTAANSTTAVTTATAASTAATSTATTTATTTVTAPAISSVTTSYTYNEQNRLISTVQQSGRETVTEKYSYDSNGNTIAKRKETVKPADPAVTGGFSLSIAGRSSISSEATYYQYDVWNQLAKTTAGSKTISYCYNGEGYRTAKTENGQRTNYLYEADRVILETDANGNETARNIYGINLLTRTAGSDTMNYMYNGHGDVTALLGTDGTVKGTYYYDAFGNIVEQTGNVNNNITYAGYQYDAETDLYYLNARYYDSKIARFLTQDTYTGDPNDPLSLNLYTYCHNEPIRYTDPTGHSEKNDILIDKNSDEYKRILKAGDTYRDASSRTGNYAYMPADVIESIKKQAHAEAEAARMDYAHKTQDLKYIEAKYGTDTKKAIVNIQQNVPQKYQSPAINSVLDQAKPSNVVNKSTTSVRGTVKTTTSQGASRTTEKSWPAESGIYKTKDLPKPLLNDPIDDYYEPMYTLYITQEDIDGFVIVTSILQPEIKMASNAIKYLGSLFEGAGNATKGAGTLTGSLDKLSQAERTMVNDLLRQGKNVEIVPRSNVQGVKTPDFKVNGVLTELKSLEGTSLNTPVTRIQKGFGQGAQTVIIDGRATGLTAEQANTVINRINGIYKNGVPGKIEIWTNEGTIFGGK